MDLPISLTFLLTFIFALLYTGHTAFGFLHTTSRFLLQDHGTCCYLFPDCLALCRTTVLSFRFQLKATSSEKSSLIITSKLVSPQALSYHLDLFPLELLYHMKSCFLHSFFNFFNIYISPLKSKCHEKIIL